MLQMKKWNYESIKEAQKIPNKKNGINDKRKE